MALCPQNEPFYLSSYKDAPLRLEMGNIFTGDRVTSEVYRIRIAMQEFSLVLKQKMFKYVSNCNNILSKHLVWLLIFMSTTPLFYTKH